MTSGTQVARRRLGAVSGLAICSPPSRFVSSFKEPNLGLLGEVYVTRDPAIAGAAQELQKAGALGMAGLPSNKDNETRMSSPVSEPKKIVAIARDQNQDLLYRVLKKRFITRPDWKNFSQTACGVALLNQ